MFRKKVFGIAMLAVLAVIVTASVILEKSEGNFSEKGIFVMDTYCTISLDSEESEKVSGLLYELDSAFDSFDENSDISRLNSGLPIESSTLAGKLIIESISLQEKYGGNVDITSGALTRLWDITGDNPHVPAEQELEKVLPTIGREHILIKNGNITLDTGTKLDMGAVAKGYALDRVKDLLDETDTSCGVVSMTSSMLLYGEKDNGELFKVAVRGAGEGEILGTIETEGCFVSSSGSYERSFTDDNGNIYSHIFDIHTGYPIETDLAAVTVLCKSGIMSDYLSTMIFIGGSDNIEKHLHSDEYKIVASDTEGNLYVSDGLVFEKNKN